MRPLEGVRVVDLSRLLPGPACTWYLHGLGAEVIKVEEPAGGDYLRHVPPFGEDGVGVWFSALNAGKRSIALDLRAPAHRAALRALLGRADVLLEGFRPGVMARLGLDPDELSRSFPRLVIASLSGYGQTGPLAPEPGHDLNYVGLAGLLALPARHEGVPDVPGVQVADLAGGALTAALGIVAALFERARTGRGRWLDLSMTEGAMALAVTELASAWAGQPARPGEGTLTGGLPNYSVYRCQDGRLLSVAALEPRFWEALGRAIGEVPIERDALAALFASRPRDAWVAALGGACVAPVLELDEVSEHPQHRARGAVVGEGTGRRLRPPFLGAAVGESAPALGQHTEAELRASGFDPTLLEEAAG